MLNLLLIYLIYLISCSTNLVLCSEGDKHYIYQSCLHHCQQINCSTSSGLNSFHLKQSVFEQLTFWSCPDECAYQCMWKTVNHMQKNEKRVAQFHGKWPFIRLFGIQEPASTLFSIANFISHYYYGFRVIRKRLQYRVHPLYNVWLCFSIVALNAWIWSAIFHTRDKPFTEKMDYICAIELLDFEPIAWIIDAHSLWHFSTIILPLLWYQFVIDDSNYLLGAPYH
ncbi:unnamed protein product [Didymodactylos carnosus]|uniref:Post-GPI attachment to proteins factor 3 n=1 Tax=Didymodactylos carnosus TaxID=1234261 RepID=A0A813SDA7_9BILA|nr:unnamed protein product [Didymodactylos carnosus]CAF0795445.1 unnamed protein product [Didymodactylos carnosus]CAF3516766.1 unnamed protein product [Didymodactylos carnosus]CAF3579989.1 unnamed protein product [Didymodactylos carnosus]